MRAIMRFENIKPFKKRYTTNNKQKSNNASNRQLYN